MTTPIRGLGEIALRVIDLDVMQQFYAECIGLQLMRRFPNSAFFRIAEGVAGHTQILALFDRSERDEHTHETPTSTLDHIAFGISREDYDSEHERLTSLGLEVVQAEHAWVQWRSLYVKDPEGNSVELVCYDPTVTPE